MKMKTKLKILTEEEIKQKQRKHKLGERGKLSVQLLNLTEAIIRDLSPKQLVY